MKPFAKAPPSAVFLPAALLLSGSCSPAKSEEIRTNIHSDVLQETREILVHLPDGYERSERRYPVFYVLDGEWLFTYAVGAVQFLSGEVAGRMPEMIVIGIPNTNRERDLYWHQEPFLKFLEEELIPWVEARYRTAPHRLLHGWSSGSAFCLRVFFTRPELFSNYIASGAAISERAADAWRSALGPGSHAGKRIFANTEGTTPMRVEGLARLTNLLQQSAPPGLKWKSVVLEGESHVAVAAKGLFAGLEFVYSDWTIPTEVAAQGPDSVRVYYGRVSRDYRFEVRLPRAAVSEAGLGLLYQGGEHVRTAIELLKMNVQENQDWPDAYDNLAEAYDKDNRLDLAKTSCEAAVRKARENSDPRLPAFEERLAGIEERIRKGGR
jgi:uncharacterized protein